MLQLKEIPKDMKHYHRCQIVALSKSGIANKTISKFTDCSTEIVKRWSKRNTIYDNQRCGCPVLYNEAIQLKTTAIYCQTTPLPDCGRWTLRTLGKYIENDPTLTRLPSCHSTIHRFLQKQALKPHRSKYFLHITDPDFFPKMEHLIELYLEPPEYLFAFDECPGIQILQRLAPALQSKEMKLWLEEFEYIRNGTMDVFAFLRTGTGKIFVECRANHQIQTLLEVFEKHFLSLPEKAPLHYVLDNLASHSSYELCELVARYSHIECPSEKELDTAIKRRWWLQSENKRIVFHFTPFHGSWLNRVEVWLGILQQKCLKESFDSPRSIYNAIYEFANLWNSILAHPFEWKYDGKGLHQKVVNRFITMLEDSITKMNRKFLTKQFLLMGNLIENYQTEIEFESLLKLHELISINYDRFNMVIMNDGGPRKMRMAKTALVNLINSLNIHVNHRYRKSA
ncbi:MAG: transposase [bacterium]